MTPDLLSPNQHTILETAVHPRNHLAFLSQAEIDRLIDRNADGLYPLIRSCALAILNSGVNTDDSVGLFAKHQDFDLTFARHPRGLRITLHHAPKQAFVDGVLIETIHDMLFAMLRDLLLIRDLVTVRPDQPGIAATDLVFQVLRNAKVLDAERELNTIVCWGGHAINKVEYDYSVRVGEALGLRRFDICTGCGPGAMKGPMRGAAHGHRRQSWRHGRFIGITEPGIIAAEPPNGVVGDLVIMPDIEKRLEAFVRIAHGLIIFPGGVGTFEEILYLMAILNAPHNHEDPLPVVLTGPVESTDTLHAFHTFLVETLGSKATGRLELIIDDPGAVAGRMVEGREAIRRHRRQAEDAYFFNWTLAIEDHLKIPFTPSHEAMASLNLHRDQPATDLAQNLRALFSGIVSGNVKPAIQAAIQRNGPFIIRGDPTLMHAVDRLLARLVAERRMKMQGGYTPCYRIQTE